MSIPRKLLLPFSLLYGGITSFRNFLYDKGIIDSHKFPIPVIAVGNLSTGGTGKTPMIEYLIDLLIPKYTIVTLSRGYGRKSKGYRVLNKDDHALTVGDEPLQFKLKYPQVVVAVDENRVRGVLNLMDEVDPQVILLDDALQHRKIEAGLNILLTSFNNLYSNDAILPAGNLRETASGANRANIIVVTKCPTHLSAAEQEEIGKELRLEKRQKLFFSFIEYGAFFINEKVKITKAEISNRHILLVTGIAKPQPLLEHLQKEEIRFEHAQFPDHHNFTPKELNSISKAEVILTTEKDYVRLRDVIQHPHLYYIPIKQKFLSGSIEFDSAVLQYITNEK
ncbi:tetraacyldisaccharide 4'-kinase [soil metagenome]